MTITLPPELEAALAEQARQQGTTPELLALDSLQERFLPSLPEPSVEGKGTLADFLAEFIGVVHSSEQIPGGARMSEDSGRKFAEGMAQKRKVGKL